MADRLRLDLGATVSVRAEPRGDALALPPAIFHVIGVGDFLFAAANELIAATSLDAADGIADAAARDTADLFVAASRAPYSADDEAAAIERARPDLRASTNAALVEQFN